MAADTWPGDDAPDSLWDICLSYCIHHLETFADYDSKRRHYSLREGITLPGQVCESLLSAFPQNRVRLEDKYLHIFKNTQDTHLKRINVRSSVISDKSIKWLARHAPIELDISDCTFSESKPLTVDSIYAINKYCKNLVALYVGNTHEIFKDLKICKSATEDSEKVFGGDYIFDCPNLRAFSVHALEELEDWQPHELIATILNPFRRLSHLDLSSCQIDIEYMDCLQEMTTLTSLVLYNVQINNIQGAFNVIGKLKQLRALDVSQSTVEPVTYMAPEENLQHLVRQLPELRKLDLSGTNLAGFEGTGSVSHRPSHHMLISDDCDDQTDKCSIPGLEGRRFDFLGLLGCSNQACHRQNIPATQVTGDATEQQVILSVKTYVDRPDLLVKSLNHLFHIFRFSVCNWQKEALNAILTSMKRHPQNKHVQISGSASLFYIVKEKKNFCHKIKRAIISAILDGMDYHMDEPTMMRNGCLTLCHFKIPLDVRFAYERIVRILLRMVSPPDQEEFVQRIGIYLLNSLACQVDGEEKMLVGNLGAISTMLAIIRERLNKQVCDEVMEISWSTMWNVTDETAENCARFISAKGMQAFLNCLEVFPDKPELLRNMMGLMGNVAEVKHLRRELMRTEYVTVFNNLLDSNSDGIEVSYNACGVLAHLVSDGPSVWTINNPTRQETLDRMVAAINRWNIRTKRNINYRSFEPILRLVPQFETPQAQHWAVWALCNLTTMYPKKYCPLVEKEKGLQLLDMVVNDNRPYATIRHLAGQVIDLCTRYKEDPDAFESPMEVEGVEAEEVV